MTNREKIEELRKVQDYKEDMADGVKTLAVEWLEELRPKNNKEK